MSSAYQTGSGARLIDDVRHFDWLHVGECMGAAVCSRVGLLNLDCAEICFKYNTHLTYLCVLQYVFGMYAHDILYVCTSELLVLNNISV